MPEVSIANKFNVIVKIVPLFTGLFLFLETSKIAFYYFLFDFDVIAYLSFTYILMCFLGDISIAFTFVIIYMFNMGLMFMLGQYGFIKFSLPVFFAAFLATLILAGFITFYYMFYNQNIGFNLLMTLICMFFASYIYQLNERKSIKKGKPLPTTFNFYIVIIVFAFSFIFIVTGLASAKRKQYRLKQYIETRTTELILKDGQVIHPRSNEYFIGNTQDYYFTYNHLSKSVRVINNDDIMEVHFNR
jgi:hypothetical protein